MRNNRPNPFFWCFLTIIPFLMFSTTLSVLIPKCIELHAALDYHFMSWVLGIGGVSLWVIVMRLAWIGETYVLKYIYLSKLLQQKGLQSWVDEANNKLK